MKKFYDRGFTLLETMIVMAIFSAIITAIVFMFIGLSSVFDTQGSQIKVTNDARAIMHAVETHVREADQILASRSFSGVSYISSTSTIVFELPAITATGDIIAGIYDYAVVYATGTDAYMITEAGAGSTRIASTRHLASTTLSFLITYDNNVDYTLVRKVAVDVVTQATIRKKTARTHLHQQIYLRNTP